jgi:hypothetical protein
MACIGEHGRQDAVAVEAGNFAAVEAEADRRTPGLGHTHETRLAHAA